MDIGNGALERTLLDGFACVLEPTTAIYTAVPVTSGLRLWKLARELSVADLGQVEKVDPGRYEFEVLLPNRANATEFAASARKRYVSVIDPSPLVIPEWSQKQYWLFWEKVISRFVKALLLSPDWPYSRGCVYECMFAIRHSIPVLSAEDRMLDIGELRSIVGNAIRERQSFGIEAGFLDEFIQVTREISAKKGQYPT